MSCPDRVSHFSRSAGTSYVIAAVVLWSSAVLTLLFTHLKWMGALDFVAGLVCLLMWQTGGGQDSVSN
jgi:hypothetical protein